MSDSSHFSQSPKTVIVTGGSGDIGAATIKLYATYYCNVVIADLASRQQAAQSVINTLPQPSRGIFYPTDVTRWSDVRDLFEATMGKFGRVDIVIANAGIMESRGFYDFEEDDAGELKEPVEGMKVIDVNLNGTMNTIHLAMYHMRTNPLSTSATPSRGSIVLIASTSGYFGGTGVVSYISSKHGIVGLARASQKKATEFGIRLNVVAPFFTPTYITTGYSEKWRQRGLPENKLEDVAKVIVETSVDEGMVGGSVMVAGGATREIEHRRTEMVREWLGDEINGVMQAGGKFFNDTGGYTLPKKRS